MKIESQSPLSTAPARRRARAKAGEAASFFDALSPEVPQGQSVGGAEPTAPVDALLALQEVATEPLGREEARRHGETLLDRLEDLRHALLFGALPRAELESLAAGLAARRERIADPRLAEVVQEIELRTAVELAKLGQ